MNASDDFDSHTHMWHQKLCIPSRVSSKSSEAFMTTLSDFKETVRQQADIVRVIGDYIHSRSWREEFTACALS